jgi:Phage tail tube protein, GTA-gp10
MQQHIDLDFADGKYRFALNIPGIVAIEKKAGIGIGAVAIEVFEGRWHYETVLEVIRQGLICGKSGLVNGMAVDLAPIQVNHLLDTYVAATPLREQAGLAQIILSVALDGYEPIGETEKKSGETDSAETESMNA